MCWGDLLCVVVMLERSPPHLFFIPALFLAKKKTKETERRNGSTDLNT
jgi:hypothetical protein